MQAEIIFPYLTGLVLFISVAVILMVYRRIGVPALLVLAIGLLAVGLESVFDGYEASLRLAYDPQGSWDAIPQDRLGYVLAVDTIRGIFIVIWAAMELLFVFMIAGMENKAVKYGLPAAVLILGTLETIIMNYRPVYPLDTRIFQSSAIRVLVFLVPSALFAGMYILYTLYREAGTRSSLVWGIGFIVHGLTLPFYPMAKEAGSIALGLWYSFGGVIPALLVILGALYLEKEVKEAVVEEEEETAE